MFGAVLGGEFVAAMVLVGKHGIDMATVALAAVTALVCLFLLRAMRRAITVRRICADGLMEAFVTNRG